MKTSYVRKLLVLFAAFMLAVSFARGSLAEEYTAQTMRLLHYEGEVEILDTSGKSRFVMENARFKSGEAMRTGENSVASVSLDATKIVTMDQLSLVEFIKQANHLLLTIKQGTLLLDVQEKLDENESLDVQTSTMTVGVRGTVIAASEYTLNGVKYSKISVLEGVTQVSYTDGNGVRQSFQLSAGYTAVLADQNGNGWVDAPPEIKKTEKEDTEGFVDDQLKQDAKLSRRVGEAKAYSPGEDRERQSRSGSAGLYSADGDWEWTDEVYLVAQSASKIYDGKPLTRASDVLVEGLPSEFRCVVYATGSLTDAGKILNPVGDWQIYNSKNENVTGHFTNVIKKAGQLIVEPAPLTVKTGGAEKTYDGTPLTNPEKEIMVLSGVSVEPEAQTPAAQSGGAAASASRNISYLADPSLKNQTLYGVSGVVTVHGTNPLTGKPCEIQLLAGYKLTVFLNSGEGQESLEFLTEKLSVDELPKEILRIYANNPETMRQACKETGWNEEAVKKRIADLKISSNQKLVEQDGVQIAENEADRLLAEFTNVHLSIDSSITDYNGRALGGQEAEFVTVPVDSRISVTATGSRTNAGTSENAFKIDWGTARQENYTVEKQLGKLTVYAAEAAVTTGSSKKVYDGQPLTNSEASITGLKNGETARVIANGRITGVGTTDNTYTIEWGSANKDNYSVRGTLGILEVEPLQLEVNLGGVAMVYNGKLEIPNATITYLNGSHKGESVMGRRARSLSALFSFSLFTGEEIRLEVTAEELGGGAYALTGSASFSEGSENNYSLSFTGTTMTVQPRELKITTSSASKTYDGTPLTSSEVTVEGLAEGETIVVTADGSQTAVGISHNTYTIDWGTAKAENYTVTETLGTLEVTANNTPVVFAAPSAEKTYDGTALTADKAAASGLPAGFTFTATVSGSQTVAGSSESKVTAYQILNSAGVDVTDIFTDITTQNGTLTVNKKSVAVTTGSANKTYDGTALTNAEADITGLVNGETATVTATGSQTEMGSSDNTYTIDWGATNKDNYTVSESLGTLTVTGNSASIVFTAPSASKTYDGTALTAGEATVKGLPAGYTFTATVSGSQTDAGSSESTVTAYQILNGDGTDVTASFNDITTENGTLTVNKKNVTVTTGSDSKIYDGTALTNAGADIMGLVNGETATVTATGSQTEIGSSDNTYTINWGTANKNNYTVSEFLGILTVMGGNTSVVFTAPSASKTYDGTALTAGEATVTGLPAGYTFTATVSGSQTNAGSSESTVTAYQILNGDGTDVTASFNDITTENGTLTVNKKNVTVTTGSDSKIYDGTALTNAGADIMGLVNGETATVTATGSQTEMGSSNNTYTIDWGTTNKDNYTVSESLGTLTVTGNSASVVFTAPSASKTYDGTALTAGEATVTGLPAGYTFTATVSGSQTDAGSSESKITAYTILDGDGTNVTASFNDITTENGTLTVNKKNAMVTTGSDSKIYDGTALTNAGADITGLVNGETATVTATGSQTLVGSSYNTYTIDWGMANKDNYTITENVGELKVTANTTAIEIKAKSLEKEYDGTELTASGIETVTGLPAGHEVEAEVSGSQTAVGTGTSTVTSYVIRNAGGDEVTGCFTGVTTAAGELKVTANTTAIEIKAKSLEKEYDGTALTASGIETVTGLPDGHEVEATVSGSQTAVGTGTSTVTSYVIRNAGGDEVTGCFTGVTTAAGELKVTANTTAIVIKAGSASKDYNGTMLTADGVEWEGLPDNHFAVGVVTGSQTAVGRSYSEITEGTVRIYNGDEEDVTAYFTNVTIEKGTLTVYYSTPITITAPSDDKVYDGYPLEAPTDAPQPEGLPEGYWMEAAKEEGLKQDGVGSTPIHVTGYTIWNEDEENVTDFFTKVTLVPGSLRIDPLVIHLYVSGEYSLYEGMSDDPRPVYGASAVTASIVDGPWWYSVTAEQNDATTWTITVEDLGESFTLTASVAAEGGATEFNTEYPMTCSVSGACLVNYGVDIDDEPVIIRTEESGAVPAPGPSVVLRAGPENQEQPRLLRAARSGLLLQAAGRKKQTQPPAL